MAWRTWIPYASYHIVSLGMCMIAWSRTYLAKVPLVPDQPKAFWASLSLFFSEREATLGYFETTKSNMSLFHA